MNNTCPRKDNKLQFQGLNFDILPWKEKKIDSVGRLGMRGLKQDRSGSGREMDGEHVRGCRNGRRHLGSGVET